MRSMRLWGISSGKVAIESPYSSRLNTLCTVIHADQAKQNACSDCSGSNVDIASLVRRMVIVEDCCR